MIAKQKMYPQSPQCRLHGRAYVCNTCIPRVFWQCAIQICHFFVNTKRPGLGPLNSEQRLHSDGVLLNPQYLDDNAKCSWMEFALLQMSGVAGQVLPLGTSLAGPTIHLSLLSGRYR